MKTRTLRSVVYFASGLGLIVSLFAAAEYLDVALRGVCQINSFFSCSAVDRSGLTTTLGVQDYLWGIGGFIVIIALAALAERRPNDRVRAYVLLAVTTAGVAVSLYFLYVELGLIHALCIVCALAYLCGGVAWVGAIALVARAEAARATGDEDDRDLAGAPDAEG